MKKNRIKNDFLEQLRKLPIIQVACEKLDVSRNSIYKWKKADPEFAIEIEKALTEGEALVNDLTENQLLTLIKEKNWSAISFWLRHRNPKFRDHIDITTRIDKKEALTPEQETIVRETLSLVALPSIISMDNNKHGARHEDTPTRDDRHDGSK